jgi:predicted RNA-binding protein YlxR (DUF448 family)
LLRIAAVAAPDGAGERAVVDAAARMPGRGAYLCRDAHADAGLLRPAAGCLALACRRRAIERALRRGVATDAICADAKLVESSSR